MFLWKKLAAVTLILGLVLCLGTSLGMAASKKLWIGISEPNDTHPMRMLEYNAAMEYERTHPNVKFIITSARLDAAKQIADIEDLISRGVDMVLINAHNGEAIIPALKRLKAAGIPFIAFDRRFPNIDPVVQEQKAFIGCSHFDMGKAAGEFIAEALHGAGNVVILDGAPGGSSQIERRDGFLSVVKKTPGLKIIADQVGMWQREKAVQIMENLLQAHPKIDAVWCANDEMALGAVKAAKAAGRLDEMIITGLDGQKDAIKAVIDGEMGMTVRMPDNFPTALDVAVAVLTGQPYKQETIQPIIVVTKKNAEQMYNPKSIF